MKISRTKFVITFLVTAFVFQFITNSILSNEVSLFPNNGEWFTGAGSAVSWKNTLATIVYPVKYILISPLLFLAKDPDPAPPVLLFTFSLYWTAIALVIFYIINKLPSRKKT